MARMTETPTTAETVHLRLECAGSVACGITGQVCVTERLSEATCNRCHHDTRHGPGWAQFRAGMVELAHAEALALAAQRAEALVLAAQRDGAW